MLKKHPITFLDFLLQFLVRMRKLTSVSRIKGYEEQMTG